MSLVEAAFGLYLTRITPPPSQLQAAQRSHTALREFLHRDDYFGGMITSTFLNGSYARNTVIRPIKDVDIIVVVGEDWLHSTPAKAMESLRRKLAQRYDQWRTLRQRRAVRVTLFDMQLDVLLGVADRDVDHPLWIPDRRQDQWILTHPKLQLALTKRLTTTTGGNYTRLVRLLKGWASERVAGRDRPASFVLECAAYHVVRSQCSAFAGPLDEGFVLLLEGLRAWDFGRESEWLPWTNPDVRDPALADVNVAERWPHDEADRFRARIEHAIRQCEGVRRSRWEETEVANWRAVFAGKFPGPDSVRRSFARRS